MANTGEVNPDVVTQSGAEATGQQGMDSTEGGSVWNTSTTPPPTPPAHRDPGQNKI